MNARLTSSPEFTIRQLETDAEVAAFVHLNAATFRPDEDVQTIFEHMEEHYVSNRP